MIDKTIKQDNAARFTEVTLHVDGEKLFTKYCRDYIREVTIAVCAQSFFGSLEPEVVPAEILKCVMKTLEEAANAEAKRIFGEYAKSDAGKIKFFKAMKEMTFPGGIKK